MAGTNDPRVQSLLRRQQQLQRQLRQVQQGQHKSLDELRSGVAELQKLVAKFLRTESVAESDRIIKEARRDLDRILAAFESARASREQQASLAEAGDQLGNQLGQASQG